MERIKIINAKMITPYRIVDNGVILIEDGIIKHAGKDRIYVKAAKLSMLRAFILQIY